MTETFSENSNACLIHNEKILDAFHVQLKLTLIWSQQSQSDSVENLSVFILLFLYVDASQ